MGTLYVLATPIGNLEDISLRALRILLSVDIIACEDTRRTGLLLSELKKRHVGLIPAFSFKEPTLVAYYDEVEHKRAPELLEQLEMGKSVALVTDAGTPLISDPGYLIVSQAHKLGIAVSPVPGPSAAVAALSVSGLPPTPFLFVGYPPEKKTARQIFFEQLPSETTIVMFCAPHKLRVVLEDMKSITGDSEIVICRELTKQFEQVWRGTISEALENVEQFKGELVLLKR